MARAHVASTSGSFLHAVDSMKRRVFIHQQELDVDIADCLVGDLIEMGDVISTPRGIKALRCVWAGRPEREPEAEVTVPVVYVDHRKGFGFVRLNQDRPVKDTSRDTANDVIVHVSGAVDYNGRDSEIFDKTYPGVMLRGVVKETFRGKRLDAYDVAYE